MKIAVVGCGALGSYYGAKLCRDGHEVHFLLRSDYETVQKNGVQIFSVDGNFVVRPHCALKPEEIGQCDLVLIGIKTTGNEQLKKLLPPLTGEKTMVLTLQNGLGNEEWIAGIVGQEKVLGGLCYVCLNRLAPGEIHHFSGGYVVMGEYKRLPGERTHNVADMIRHTGIQCQVIENLERAHWEKLVWNIPFNGLGVAACAGYEAMVDASVEVRKKNGCMPTDKLLADPRWERLAREIMLEIIACAEAAGMPIPMSLAEKQMAFTRKLGCYRASTLMDFDRGLPLELDSLFVKPLERAHQLGVRVPFMQRLCDVLKKLSHPA